MLPKVLLLKHFYPFSTQFRLFQEKQLLEFSEIQGIGRKVLVQSPSSIYINCVVNLYLVQSLIGTFTLLEYMLFSNTIFLNFKRVVIKQYAKSNQCWV